MTNHRGNRRALTSHQSEGLARPQAEPGIRHKVPVAGRCQSPVTVERYTRPLRYDPQRRMDAVDRVREQFPGAKPVIRRDFHTQRRLLNGDYMYRGHGSENPLLVEYEVPCRKCAWCRHRKRAMWVTRIKHEVEQAPRTWMLTFTFKPSMHHRMIEQARVRLWKAGTDFDTLSETEKFAEQHSEYTEVLTRYWKRVRKGDFPVAFEEQRRREAARLEREYEPLPVWQTAFRYVLVTELHTEKLKGLPHMHALVHDYGHAVDKPVRWDLLSEQYGEENPTTKRWVRYGNMKAKLVDEQSDPTYCAKYLSKEAIARVRASLNYGGKKEQSDTTDNTLSKDRPKVVTTADYPGDEHVKQRK